MAALSYRQERLILVRGGGPGVTERQVRDLQRDLRRLGYLRKGIDGIFGRGTERAVKALQHDLLHNDGRGSDASAPVRVLDYNRGRVIDVDGHVDQGLVECISDLLDDDRFPKLPAADDPFAENRRIAERIASLESREVPIPFLVGILKQESNLKHFNEPRGRDEDAYIVVGLDTNASQRYIVTSRGYGAGQYTLFHHPPHPLEVDDFMLDPARNVEKAIRELREKFDHFVNGTSSGTRADDRIAEIGRGPLRVCKYAEDDPRFLKDCRRCVRDAGTESIESGVTPFYEGSTGVFRPTQYYRKADYRNAPVRRNVGCDWPYAVRRYNGAGVNSYHYQVRILNNVHRL